LGEPRNTRTTRKENTDVAPKPVPTIGKGINEKVQREQKERFMDFSKTVESRA
jgi:hypothetical protein